MAFPIEQQSHHCTLEVTALLNSPASVKLHYRVRNNTDQILFLFNRFWTSINANGEYQVQPNMVNVQASSARVVVSKAVVAVPEDMEVEKHYTPCLSRLGPHDTYEETLEIPVPLVPFTWYQAPWNIPAAGTEQLALRPLYFELGYLVVSPEREAIITQVATSQEPAYFWATEPEDQLLVGAGPLLPSIEVLL
ncbi:hypothetical protein [Hymenobacter glaciei]|uniref:hypothetical protein n=1 Tax=Hymenobacter glaciei TaxID=877209 RepID=UPI0031F12394